MNANEATPRWTVGQGTAVTWPGGLALLGPDVSAATAERLWSRMKREPGLGTFLKTLSESVERGFLDLPPFAVAVFSETQCHVAVRGDYTVDIASTTGTEALDGEAVTTWAERVVAMPQFVSLSPIGTTIEAEGAPLADGLVPAGQVWAGIRPVDSPPAAAGPVPTAKATPAAVKDATPAAQPVNPVEPAVAAEPESQVPERATRAPEGQATVAPGEELSTLLPDREETAADDEAENAPEADDPGTDAEDDGPNAYASLFAPSELELPEEAPAHPLASDQLDGDTIAEEGQVEFMLPVPVATTAPRPGAPTAPAQNVLARFCDRGHANPPERGNCFVCGALVSGEARQTARPQLGWVRVEGLETLPLVGPVIVGRNPSSAVLRLPQSPRLLALPFEHISSTHLAFLLEGWRVLVRDLRSKNGSFLRRNDRPPVRLPETPYPLSPGDHIELGKGITIHLDKIP